MLFGDLLPIQAETFLAALEVALFLALAVELTVAAFRDKAEGLPYSPGRASIATLAYALALRFSVTFIARLAASHGYSGATIQRFLTGALADLSKIALLLSAAYAFYTLVIAYRPDPRVHAEGTD